MDMSVLWCTIKKPNPKNVKQPRASAIYYAITHEWPCLNHYCIGCFVQRMIIQHYRVDIYKMKSLYIYNHMLLVVMDTN